jgi:6-phosphofructokinase 1
MASDAIGRLAILTSGGDAPGMNAAIRAATMLALARGWEVLGVAQGYRGLVQGALSPLGPSDVGNILREGGTILGSARCPEFHDRRTRDVARAHLREAGVGALLVIGGNGSLAGAAALSDPGEAGDDPVRVLGLPASIDNDLAMTGTAIGVDTAMNTIMEACDKLADTADAHDRTFLVEVMGRDCGYLAMTSAIAAGADVVLFPEQARSEDEIISAITDAVRRVRARADRSRRVMVIKAEGVKVPIDRIKQRVDEALMEGAADPLSLETRVTVLGHVVRGGRPTAFDRLLASRLAHVAVHALGQGATRKMASWLPPVTPPGDVARPSPVDPYCWLVDLEAVLSATAQLLDGQSELARWRIGVFAEVEAALRL